MVTTRKQSLDGGGVKGGMKFGLLTAVSIASAGGKDGAKWHCLCGCGDTAIVRARDLISKHTRSCGCLSANQAEEQSLFYTDRQAYLRLMWERYGTLYGKLDDQELRQQTKADFERAGYRITPDWVERD